MVGNEKGTAMVDKVSRMVFSRVEQFRLEVARARMRVAMRESGRRPFRSGKCPGVDPWDQAQSA